MADIGEKIKSLYSEQELGEWDQRVNLVPFKYKYGMKRIVKGLDIGDPLFDDLDPKLLLCHGQETVFDQLPQQADPEWVDWEKVERGQKLWQANLSRAVSSLSMALIAGFSISRFAEVLYHNGYAQSPGTAIARYSETLWHITDFMRFDLKDRNSRAHQALYSVRSMHAFARRKSKRLFDKEKGEGIALSQYDMSEVLLGFSGVTLVLIEKELGYGPYSREEKEAMIHFWRYCGFHLGIMDEYNCCNSLEDCEACVEDYLATTPRRLECLRPCTEDLRQTAMQGFAWQTGLGYEFWRGAFDIVYQSKQIDLSHLRAPNAFKPGMDKIARFSISMSALPGVAELLNRFIIHTRELKRNNLKAYKRNLAAATHLSKFHDQVIWRLLSSLYIVRYFVALVTLLYNRKRIINLLRRFRALVQ